MRGSASVALGGLGAWAMSRALRSRRAVSFRGRVAVISGGSRGLGLLLARRLADEGARVALLARTEADLDAAVAEIRERYHAEALGVACDVGDWEAVGAAVRQVVETMGRPSLLVHNAGVIEVGPEPHMDERDYREALDTHFWGAYYLTEAVKPHLPRDGTGRDGSGTSPRSAGAWRSPTSARTRRRSTRSWGTPTRCGPLWRRSALP